MEVMRQRDEKLVRNGANCGQEWNGARELHDKLHTVAAARFTHGVSACRDRHKQRVSSCDERLMQGYSATRGPSDE